MTLPELIAEVRRLQQAAEATKPGFTNEHLHAVSAFNRFAAANILELVALAERQAAEVERLRKVLAAYVAYEPREIVKDDFAYDRLLANIQETASAALAAKE